MMRDLEFDNIFTNNEIQNYNLFIGKLKDLKSSGYKTKELLSLIAQYYQGYVTYNYDQLQIVKLNRNESNEPGFQCYKAKETIRERISEINEISQKGEVSLEEIIEQLREQGKGPFSKEEAIELLDSVFLNVEGRTLTESNIKNIFENYGERKHIPHREAETSGIFKVNEVKEHDEIIGINTQQYPSVYNNQMLVDGVCDEYVKFEAKICSNLGIKHRIVSGVGTTGHSWSLIYLEDEDRWVHFDMTMVKFYQDNWIKEHQPYTMQDWVVASTKDIFVMQPTRRIESIGNKKCNVSNDNYLEFNVNEYVQEDGLERL